jgi:hypothetical protein
LRVDNDGAEREKKKKNKTCGKKKRREKKKKEKVGEIKYNCLKIERE